jgi:hypothetical protein
MTSPHVQSLRAARGRLARLSLWRDGLLVRLGGRRLFGQAKRLQARGLLVNGARDRGVCRSRCIAFTSCLGLLFKLRFGAVARLLVSLGSM